MEILIADEKSTVVFTHTLVDDSGTAIELASLSSVTLSLYSLEDPAAAVINSRNAQDIKNVNGGAVHATSGLLTLTLTPADNAIVDSTRGQERHRGEVRWTYSSGTKTGSVVFMVLVSNLKKVS